MTEGSGDTFPKTLRSPLALRAGADLPQIIVGVDTTAVAVIPVNL
jgi:hypothetical protein